MPLFSDHWKFFAELSEKIPDSVIRLISSPLAPHSPAPMTFPRLVKLFGTPLSTEEDEIVSFVGDFFGGTVVLTVMLDVWKSGPKINGPTKMMLIASIVDLRFSNSKIGEVERYDPVLRLPIEIETTKSWVHGTSQIQGFPLYVQNSYSSTKDMSKCMV